MGFLEKLKGSNAYKSFTEKFQELKERQQETEADDQLDERSPYAQIGSIARKVGTAGLAVAGAATRSTSMLGNAISAITGIEDGPIGGKSKTDEEYNQMEIESQSGVSRQSGYIPDRFGNPSRKMTQDEADAYLKENPDHKFPEGFEPDPTPFSVSIGMNEAKADESAAKAEIPESLKNVPEVYRAPIQRAVDHLNRFIDGKEEEPEGRVYKDRISPKDIITLITGEGNFDAEAGNPEVDFGATQLNEDKRKDFKDPNPENIWGQSWQNNFKNEYGEFDEKNPEHQVIAAGIILAASRQRLYDLYKEGKLRREPTKADIYAAYNMEVGQVSDAINGEDYLITITDNDKVTKQKMLQKQYKDYLDHLRSQGLDI